MSNSYEDWTRSEITRLRAEAQKALVEADALQRALDKLLAMNGAAVPAGLKRPSRKAGRRGGSKNDYALAQLRAAPNGMTTDELYQQFVGFYGPSYKRSSLRALLFNQKNLGHVKKHGDRYMVAVAQAA